MIGKIIYNYSNIREEYGIVAQVTVRADLIINKI